jgi:glucosamine-6-phosphate deaminase
MEVLIRPTSDDAARLTACVLASAICAKPGPVTSMISASALQLHPRCTVIVDEDAAANLQNQQYYRWLYEHEPEWEPYRNNGV